MPDLTNVPLTVQSTCWFMFDHKWAAVKDLNLVWSSTLLCGTSYLHKAMMSQWSILRALLLLTLLSTKFNCSKHGVIMIRGCQATVRTCNDYSGSNVLKMGGGGGHDYLLLLTHESSCWVHYWTSIAMCVPDFDEAMERKRRKRIWIYIYRERERRERRERADLSHKCTFIFSRIKTPFLI